MLEAILNQPLTQILGIVVIAGLLQKMGVDVAGITKWVFTHQKNGKEEEKTPAWAAQLLQYFNHDTTEHHTRTHELLEKVVDKMDAHNKMEEGNRAKLDEILKYGVPCAKEK